MKKRYLYYLFIFFHFLSCSVDKGSAEIFKQKVTKKQENNVTYKEDPKMTDLGSFKRKINGKDFVLKLDGAFQKKFEFPNIESPLEVKEVYPGIVYFDQYDSIKILPYHQNDSTWVVNKEIGYLEFYEDKKLYKRVDINQLNPYLHESENIKILNNYSDAERTDVLHQNDGSKEYVIDTYHLNQSIKNHGPFTTINFWKREISDGLIIKTQTNIKVLDSLGVTIFNEEFNNTMSLPVIDSRGEYLMASFSPVETANSSGIKLQPDGFEIWEINPKKILFHEINEDGDMWVSTPLRSEENTFTIKYTFPNNKDLGQKIFYFNPKDGQLGFRIFKTKEWEKISQEWFTKYKSYEELFKNYPLTNIKLSNGN